ncbi:chemotaxis protein CheX [Serpentinicella sp. ANB-PHB4]|uniref:chemotaxis protein CheX n=1 Tax=Serpentinicella sp. ANB-PHB4 TaxID=3074076 RepID=UPI00286065A6|nr:chemotaxis protein CheX [Serpentinicella sp. ANB-PHB4]MDR5659762.1 chemotaxis protein CheX [Serpentinicella sp. ANB-PHB4]
MLHQYFGNYLLNNGFISAEALNKVLNQNRSTRVKLGVLAINKDLMTSEQVRQVHAQQKKMDKKFGEIAIDLGYLSEQDVESLLSEQKVGAVQLTQALLDDDIFTLEELENILNQYKAYMMSEYSSENFSNTNNKNESTTELINSYIKSQYDLFGIVPLDVVNDYTNLFYRNLIRFIDNQAFLNSAPNKNLPKDLILVKQEIKEDFNFDTYIGADPETYVKLAAVYAKMAIEKRDALADASVSEYLNLNNGLFTVNISEENYSVNLNPPTILDGEDAQTVTKDIVVPFMTIIGNIYLILQGK